MRRCKVLVALLFMLSMYDSADAFTLTFDDIPDGAGWSYYHQQYGVFFGYFFVADHSESSWGRPHSGTKVLRCSTDSQYLATIKFDHPTSGHFSVRSLGAYFSTEPGVVIRLISRDQVGNVVASTQIGSPTAAWDNVYAEISLTQGLRGVSFEGVSSPDALLHFAADDMTITPVPEPSPLLALGVGGMGLLGAALRRRVRART